MRAGIEEMKIVARKVFQSGLGTKCADVWVKEAGQGKS